MQMTSTTEFPAISTAKLGELYRSGTSEAPAILDVRTPIEYRNKHIEGSTLFPLDSLNEKSIAEYNNNQKPLYVVCQSGKRAKNFIEKVKSFGIKNVVFVEGGIMAWEKNNLPLKHGDKTISLERQVRIAAGILILTGSLLAGLVHPVWIVLPGFVGTGLIFAGISDTCGMGLMLARMPWNQ